jgi:hypothetical protein
VLYLLQQTLDEIYEETGVYSGEAIRWPTFRDVLHKARKLDVRGREAGWLASTLRALASLCFGDMGTLVNEQTRSSPDQLLDKTVILELDALTQQDKVFFAEAILLWIHHYRMAESRRETFKHAILIEEAHHILSQERRSLVGGQSVMEITFREIREFGESLILLDQHPSQIALPALGNTYTTLCLNLKHSKDVGAISQCMLLDSKENDILGSLEVGQAVAKLQGRTPRPFLIKIPEFEIKKGLVTDEMIRERTRIASDVPVRAPADPMAPDCSPPGAQQPSRAPRSTITDRETLDVLFVADVQHHPDGGVADRYKRLRISVRQGQRLKARLASARLIEEHEEVTKTGRIRRIRLTDKGRRFLERR